MHERRYAARNRSARSRDGRVAAHCWSAAVPHTGKSVNTTPARDGSPPSSESTSIGPRWRSRFASRPFWPTTGGSSCPSGTACSPRSTRSSAISRSRAHPTPACSASSMSSPARSSSPRFCCRIRRERTRHAEWRLFVTVRDRRRRRRAVPLLVRREGTDAACRTAEWHLQLPFTTTRTCCCLQSSSCRRRAHCCSLGVARNEAMHHARPRTERFAGSLGSSSSATALRGRVLQRPVRSPRRARLLRRVQPRGVHRGRRQRPHRQRLLVNNDVVNSDVVSGYSVESRHHRPGPSDGATTAVSYSGRGRR